MENVRSKKDKKKLEKQLKTKAINSEKEKNVVKETKEVKETVGVLNWLSTFLILAIPLLNLLMLFIWAFGGGSKSKSNFAKAMLLMVLFLVISTLVISLWVGTYVIAEYLL